MRKITVLISGDSKTLELPETFTWNKHILVKKATIFWEYNNAKKSLSYPGFSDVSFAVYTGGSGTWTLLTPGYWNLQDISDIMKKS